MGRSPSLRHAWPVVLALGLLPTQVFAQVTDADREAARKQMVLGRSLRDKKDLRGALTSFLAADASMHYPTTGFEVARTYADLGELVAARTTVQAVLEIVVQRSDPSQFQKARERAGLLLRELNERIPTLRIEVRGAAGPVALTVDGRAIDVDVASHAQPLDAGHHVIVLRGPPAELHEEIDLEEKATRELTLTVPAPVPAAPEPAVVALPLAPEPPVPPPVPAPERKWDRTWLFVGVGFAGAGAIAGSVTGLVSLADTSSAKSGCIAGRCPPPTYGELNSAHTFATASNVSFIVGGVGLGTALVAWLARPKPRASGNDAAYVTPWVGLGSVGARGVF